MPTGSLTRFKKLWVALAGAIAQAIAQGLINGTAAAWVSIVIAAVTAAGVFGVANTTQTYGE